MRLRRTALLAVAGLAALPATAIADVAAPTTILDEQVSTAAASRSCLDRAPAGAAGVATRSVKTPTNGIVSARLEAASGDWDVAIFDQATGRLVGNGAGFGASEVAEGFAGGGRELVVQACRRKGDTDSARVRVISTPVPEGTTDQKPSLVHIPVKSKTEATRLLDLGIDLTEHAEEDHLEAVLYGEADRRKLRAAGYTFEVEVDDLVARDRLEAAADRAFANRTQRSALPSGRDQYRRLGDYEAELKALAERNPTLVKPLTLELKTLEGREVKGVEISKDVSASDGKPVFFQMGVHHAREWPSAEHAMESAVELVNGFGRDRRITDLLERVRVIVVPIINPDGFNLSREAPVDLVYDPAFQQLPDARATPAYLADPSFAYKRRNCRVVPGAPTAPGSCGLPQFRASGTDPNRNYGGFWGGPGASAVPLYDTYRGPGPFSEPETENVRRLVSKRQVTGLITNHTFSNLVLRPPGVRAAGPPPDEAAYAELGARMTAQNGYANNPSYTLYDTTGGTEDWTYYATGGFGYTFEIGPDVSPSECGGFHPPFECTVKQYVSGQNNAGGNREAYLIAFEHAADRTKHSTITGKAPKGATLRVRKRFLTETSPVRPAEDDVVSGPQAQIEGEKIRFEDKLETSMDVTRDGTFTWSVNPSTRPAALGRSLPTVAATPSREDTLTQKRQTFPNQTLLPADAPARPYTEADTFEDAPFTVTAEDATKVLEVAVTATNPGDDYDVELFLKDAAGKLQSVGTSAGIATNERISLDDPKVGEYVLRVTNYASVSPWEAKVRRFRVGPNKIEPTRTEAWDLTCEAGGKVLAAQKVVVARGQSFDAGEVCGANAKEVVRAATASAARRRASGPSCATSAGFRSTAVAPVARGARVRFAFVRRVPDAVRVDVFQVSAGRRVLGERRVATFPGRLSTFTWDGRSNDGKRLSDGVFFVRMQVKGPRGRLDVRRATLVRRGGRFVGRPTFYRPDSCGLLASAKLERPAFGGRRNDPLRIAFRTARTSDVTVTVRRGAKVVRTIRSRGRAARRTHRLRVPSTQLRGKGLYRVTISVASGGRRASTTLVAQRL